MPEKFTFPSIQQAISLQSAQNMEEIKLNLRTFFNKNHSLKLSQNVAWSFKLSNSDTLIRRYIHCKFCHAKLTYVKEIETKDNKSNTFRLVRFNLHHDHTFIDKVKQQGKMKTFPNDYSKAQFNRLSSKKQQKQRKQKQRKKREQLNKFKKLQFYYRLNMCLKQEEKLILNVKQLAAKSIGITTDRFMCFLNSGSRGVLQVNGIKKILKKAGFEKYNIQMDNTSKLLFNKSIMQEFQNQQEPKNSQEQEKQDSKSKEKKANSAFIIEQSKQFFKDLMLFINYNQSAKINLQNSQGLINITYLEDKIISKKFMRSMKWNVIILYSHDSSFQPNQLYAIIMIESQKFNIRQIKKSFEITFKLLNPAKKINFQCCLHQQNIYIMGALDLIIEQNSPKYTQKYTKQSTGSLSYFLSPKLSQSIISKCQFIPKVFQKKLVDKIHQLDPKQVDNQYQKIINELDKASKIKEYKVRAEEFIGELKQFYENFQKIFIGKFTIPSFVGLSFIHKDEKSYNKCTFAINDSLENALLNFSKGNKYFFEFIIMIFDIFQIPNGSFIYQRHSGDMREPTKLQKNYTNHLITPQYQYFDQMKKLYRTYAYREKYYKSKTIQLENSTPDFYEQFSALLYETTYKFKSIFMKISQQIKIILIRQIQKSFTLQIQTRTVQQLKNDGIIKIKQQSKSPYTVKIINQNKFWPNQSFNSSQLLKSSSKNVIELEKTSQVIDIESSFSKNQQKQNKNFFSQKNQKNMTKKLWECECNFSKFTYLPCSHQIRCCLTFFTSIEDQIDDFWLFNPKKLQELEDDDYKSQVLTQDWEENDQSQDKEGQQNSESD